MQKIYDIKLSDVSLAMNKPLTLLSSLRILEIGYAKIVSVELWSVLAQNQHSLERLSLRWIMESNQLPIFTDCTGVKLTNLKSFSTKGPHTFCLPALMELLGNCSLKELSMESLAAPSAAQWSSFLDFLTENGRNTGKLATIKFGLATGCTAFWESAAKFIGSCSGQLTTLWINGSSRGPSGRFPTALHDCFTQMQQQQSLFNCILIWRDDLGMEVSHLEVLQNLAPNLELLHVYVRFPMEDEVNRLLELTKAYLQLRVLHFVFPTRATDDEEGYQATIKKLDHEIENGGKWFDEWAAKAGKQHPNLSEISWSTYDRMVFSGTNPAIYKKVDMLKRSKPVN